MTLLRAHASEARALLDAEGELSPDIELVILSNFPWIETLDEAENQIERARLRDIKCIPGMVLQPDDVTNWTNPAWWDVRAGWLEDIARLRDPGDMRVVFDLEQYRGEREEVTADADEVFNAGENFFRTMHDLQIHPYCHPGALNPQHEAFILGDSANAAGRAARSPLHPTRTVMMVERTFDDHLRCFQDPLAQAQAEAHTTKRALDTRAHGADMLAGYRGDMTKVWGDRYAKSGFERPGWIYIDQSEFPRFKSLDYNRGTDLSSLNDVTEVWKFSGLDFVAPFIGVIGGRELQPYRISPEGHRVVGPPYNLSKTDDWCTMHYVPNYSVAGVIHAEELGHEDEFAVSMDVELAAGYSAQVAMGRWQADGRRRSWRMFYQAGLWTLQLSQDGVTITHTVSAPASDYGLDRLTVSIGGGKAVLQVGAEQKEIKFPGWNDDVQHSRLYFAGGHNGKVNGKHVYLPLHGRWRHVGYWSRAFGDRELGELQRAGTYPWGVK